ncbi:MAG: hypothetical protein EBS23_04080 [Betaproteobacteria bacterium]|nr:hypothetical protein [Betaproteobacteria bacterium]
MIFNAGVFELYKADGHTVCGLGVEWTEPRTITEGALALLGKAFLAVGFFAGVGALVAGNAASGPPAAPFAVAAVLFFGLFVATVRAGVRTPGKVNWMEFHEDGRITASWDRTVWKTRVEDIRSIESVQLHQKKKEEDSDYTHGVRFITRRGKILRVAENLEPDDSVTLAVLLNEALEAVRYPQVGASPSGEPVAVW